ncbi:MAG TPA: hypothetical protein VG873_17360 [Burkholderiales bacterium]|nr:hypothetical protein [Burkholderiales bacterium]
MKTNRFLILKLLRRRELHSSPAQAPRRRQNALRRKTPEFSTLDENEDGVLDRSEAASDPALAARFKEADIDGDGRLSRLEYLKAMGKNSR